MKTKQQFKTAKTSPAPKEWYNGIITCLADQSKTTAQHLHELSEAIKHLLNRGQSPRKNWLQLRYLTLSSAETMSDENRQWQKLPKINFDILN